MEHEERQILRKMGPQEVAAVYEGHMRKDFPASELKPLSSIRRMQAEGIYDCLGFYEGDMLVGYAFFVADRGRGFQLYGLPGPVSCARRMWGGLPNTP